MLLFQVQVQVVIYLYQLEHLVTIVEYLALGLVFARSLLLEKAFRNC